MIRWLLELFRDRSLDGVVFCGPHCELRSKIKRVWGPYAMPDGHGDCEPMDCCGQAAGAHGLSVRFGTDASGRRFSDPELICPGIPMPTPRLG
jgi:hypothetical protein